MDAGTETKIEDALMARLASLVLVPAVPVAWPDKPFRVNGGAYIQVFKLPAQTAAFGVADASANEHRGVFAINLFWPEGVTGAIQRADAILAHFKRGTRLYRNGVRVDIISPPYPSPSLPPDRGLVQTPINVPYAAYVAN